MDKIECNISTCKNKKKDNLDNCNYIHRGNYSLTDKNYSIYYMYPNNIKCLKYDKKWYYLDNDKLTTKILREKDDKNILFNKFEQNTIDNKLLKIIQTNIFNDLKNFLNLNKQYIYNYLKYKDVLDNKDILTIINSFTNVNIKVKKKNNITYYKILNSSSPIQEKTKQDFSDILKKYKLKYVVKISTKSYYFFIN